MTLPIYTVGAGEPLLMIHGIISDGSFFCSVSERLKDTYRVISYDRYGYGAAALGEYQGAASEEISHGREEADPYSVEEQAEQAAAILRAAADQPAWIFGNSAGGLIAIELCLQHPELVRGMILLEPSFAYDGESARALDAWNGKLNGYLQQKKIKRALVAFSEIVSSDGAQESAAGSMAEMRQTYANLKNFMYGELNQVQHYRPDLAVLQSIEQPVVVYVTEEGQERLFGSSSLKGAEAIGWPVTVIPGNHNAAKSAPSSTAEAICKTIGSLAR